VPLVDGGHHLGRILVAQEAFDVGAGKERVGLGTGQDDANDAVVHLELVQQRRQRCQEALVQDRDATVRLVDPQDRDAVTALDAKPGIVRANRWGRHDATRSSSIAWPWPPAAQAVTNANEPSSTARRCIAVLTRRAPVAPNGCPSDTLPPHGLTLPMSTVPNAPGSPSFSRPNASDDSARSTASTWPANASWISITSTSARATPFRSSSRGTA